MTTAAQNAELAKPVTRTVYFVEFLFASATSRLSTANIPLVWGGFEWSGVGTLGSIGTVEESDGLESRPLNFTINSAQPAWLSLAVGSVEEYRGRAAKMYRVMDTLNVGVNDESGSITLRCETSAYGLKRRPALRLNAAQHKKVNPTDTGLDYLNDLVAKPTVWLSAWFQKQR
ncbi:hypothetical protein [Massilia sp. Leaf139]|uniref:hypothetical protein n=1 Tax=Massilia sp. Leaf139 TaxID=1736272 RepID=UPI000700EA22|nr:hypothetical protein [Massilia sp. Leaf139]KQQ89931.1 hypothetical protein ASF77_23420 [Massilia sp. Leaf139]